jgi:hypothetical protein
MLTNFEANPTKGKKESPAEPANPAPTTMHQPTPANGFSFCPTLASASFQLLLFCCARCFACKSRVLTLLRTLFLSLRSFRRSPRLFSIACGLFLQNTRGGGYLCDISAPSAPARFSGGSQRYHFPFFAVPLFSSTYKSPLDAHRFATFSVSCTYKSLFSQLLCIHIYTKRPGVTPPITFPPTVSTSLLRKFSADPTRIGIPTERSYEGRFPHVIPRLRPAKPRGIRHFPQPVLSSSHPRGIC